MIGKNHCKRSYFYGKNNGELDIIIINAIPWFVGKDIAKILGHSNPRKALIDHVDKEDKRIFSYEEFQKSQNVTFENGKITVPPSWSNNHQRIRSL